MTMMRRRHCPVVRPLRHHATLVVLLITLLVELCAVTAENDGENPEKIKDEQHTPVMFDQENGILVFSQGA